MDEHAVTCSASNSSARVLGPRPLSHPSECPTFAHTYTLLVTTRLTQSFLLDPATTDTMPTNSPPSDVFTDDGPPVVDGTLLEAAKENIRPLATGRRATALAGILATPHAKRETILANEHRRFRAAIANALVDEEDEGDDGDYEPRDYDALGEYSAYVAWTIEHYPEGHVSLVPLLEEATRALKDVRGGVYRRDARYLKLWTSYADLVERPEVIWRFLLANDIGTNWAAFYESFAAVLERSNR
jgi:hypothetical protein